MEFEMEDDREIHADEIFGDSDSNNKDLYGFDLDSDKSEENEKDYIDDEANLPEELRPCL